MKQIIMIILAGLIGASAHAEDILILLNKTADLSEAQQINKKVAKGQFVFKSLSVVAETTQAPIKSYLKNKKIKFQSHYIVNAISAYGVASEVVAELRRRADVKKITSNKPYPTLDFFIDPKKTNYTLSGIGKNISHTGADRVWNELGVRGEGIVIAGQDTGVEWDHPSLINQYRGTKGKKTDHNYNWYDAIQQNIGFRKGPCGINSLVPCDDNNHGTHTVGTIVGDDGNSNQIGMAPNSEWIACRNMDQGVGRPSTYMACFEFFLAPFPLGGDPLKDGQPHLAPHVINNSWGCPSSEKCKGDVLLEVLKAMKAAGIFVVVSAGNDGPKCKTIRDTPAWHSADTFSVGAYSHRNGTIANFSSRGPSKFDGAIGPDIVAPGVGIRSAVRNGKYSGSYSGTSMAGPHVVGLVALMWSANPKLIGKIKETESLIRKTATAKDASRCMSGGPSRSPNNIYGSGKMNAFEAVQEAKKWRSK